MYGDVFSNRDSSSLVESLLQPEELPTTGDSPTGIESNAPRSNGIIRDVSNGHDKATFNSEKHSSFSSSPESYKPWCQDAESENRTSIARSSGDFSLTRGESNSYTVEDGSSTIPVESFWDPESSSPALWSTQEEEGEIEWSPWTRRQVRRVSREGEVKWWAPEEKGWWIGVHFLIGSILFVIGAGSSLFLAIETRPNFKRSFHQLSYLLGSVEFTLGSIIMLDSTINSALRVLIDHNVTRSKLVHPASKTLLKEEPNEEVYIHNRTTNFLGLPGWNIRRATGEAPLSQAQLDMSQPLLAREDLEANRPRYDSVALVNQPAYQHLQASIAECHLKLRHKPKWFTRRYWLDLVGSSILLLGVNMYNLMVVADLVKGYLPESWWEEWMDKWLVTLPCQWGGVCFVVAAYFYWISAHCSLSLFIWKPYDVIYWISVTNMVGSIGFMFAGIVTYPVIQTGPMASIFVGNAPELFVGFFIGSAVFAAQSYLMIMEIALKC